MPKKETGQNMFVLGFVYWMYNRSMESTLQFLNEKFGKKPVILESNILALRAGFNYGETTEASSSTYTVAKANCNQVLIVRSWGTRPSATD